MSYENMKKTKLEIVAEAYACGFDTPGQVAEVTDVKATTANLYLTALRKFDFDVEKAREHLNRTANNWHTARYRSDPVWREAEKRRSREWHRRKRERANASRINSNREAA